MKQYSEHIQIVNEQIQFSPTQFRSIEPWLLSQWIKWSQTMFTTRLTITDGRIGILAADPIACILFELFVLGML